MFQTAGGPNVNLGELQETGPSDKGSSPVIFRRFLDLVVWSVALIHPTTGSRSRNSTLLYILELRGIGEVK